MPSLKGSEKPDRLRQGDAEDHQGDENGRRGEASACAGGGGGRSALFAAHGCGSGEHRFQVSIGDDAPVLMSGTGKDEVHLLVVCTSERGLCGGFNAQIARLARDHVRRLLADGKTVKIIYRRQEGLQISCAVNLGKMIIDHVDLREVKNIGFVNADQIGHKIIALFNEGEFDVCHAVLFGIQVGDQHRYRLRSS